MSLNNRSKFSFPLGRALAGLALRTIPFLSLVLCLSAQNARAATLSLVGVGDWSTPSYNPSASASSSKLGLGGGALIDFVWLPQWRIEVGGLYVTRKIDFTGESSPQTQQGSGIQIPVLLRYNFNRFISFGAGGYYTRFIGNLSETSDSTGVTANASYSANGLNDSEFGLVGSLAIHVPITYTMDLTVDGRYLYGLTNLVSDSAITGESSEKYRDFQALIGLTFHLMR